MSTTRSLLLATLLVALSAGTIHAGEVKSARAQQPMQATLEKNGAQLALAVPDVAKLRVEDALRDAKPGTPLRYGVVQQARLDALSKSGAGQWRELPGGRLAWRLEVSGQGATSLEFGFSRFRLPHGAVLTIRSADGKHALTSLTDVDNPLDGGPLHTPMLQSDSAVLELILPADKRDFLELELASASYGYRDPFTAARAKSGSCNVDAACPEGDDWRDQIASVAGYAFSANASSLYCTGTLMNTGDVAEDVARPRFSTAYHCVSTPQQVASMVFYWGYESPTCRTPGSVASGTPLPVLPNTRAVQIGGATLLATDRATDFTAVQLNTPVPQAALLYYSGWDRSGTAPPGSVGIHHANGNEKRISFNDDALTTMNNCIITSTDTTTHWRVDNWELGTTEIGSSGSGLWNRANGLLVGVLSGGQAACGNQGYDCYGRLSAAWESPSTTGSGSIRAAFDRTGTNPQILPGKDTCDAPVVTLTANAFANAPRAGANFQIFANARGGAGGYTYLWDVDGDGVVERETSKRHIMVSFPSQHVGNVRVQVRDAQGCIGSATHALEVIGQVIEVASVGEPQQVCGNSNGRIDPGERFTVPVTLRNAGDGPLAGAWALFAPVGSMALDLGPNQFGYVGSSECGYEFIDIAQGEHAVDALPTHAANGNGFGPRDDARTETIALAGDGIDLYGQRYLEAVMSTNGYISFDPDDDGAAGSIEGDALSCDGGLPEGSLGPQLRPFHDDLRVLDAAGAGLRYRHFPQCPRDSLVGGSGCHVFQWSGMETYGEDAFQGETEFQAIVYEGTGEIVYQYKTRAEVDQAYSVIGMVDATGGDALRMACPQETGQVPASQSAICAFAPTALPAGQGALRLPSPAIAVRHLPIGASTTVNVPIRVREDAACGAPLRLDYLATVAPNTSSTQASSHELGAVSGECQQVTSCSAQIPEIDLGKGNYHNLRRTGNGFHAFNQYGGHWYTGAADHTPVWYQALGPVEDSLLKAPLLRIANQTEQIGQVRIARIDADRAVMAWQFADGRTGAELIEAVHASLPAATPDYTGAWFATQEAGAAWGLTVESRERTPNRVDVVQAFIRDAQGVPRWLIGDGPIQAGVVDLVGHRPHCPGCPRYADWQTRSQEAGHLLLHFTDEDHATLGTDITLPAPLQGQWLRSNVPLIRTGETP